MNQTHAQAPPVLRKPRLVFEDANSGGDETLIRLEMPRSIELRVDGVLVWGLTGEQLLRRGGREALLRLRAVQMSDAQVAAIGED